MVGKSKYIEQIVLCYQKYLCVSEGYSNIYYINIIITITSQINVADNDSRLKVAKNTNTRKTRNK